MEMQENNTLGRLYVIYSRKVASILTQEEKKQLLEILIEKINNENPQDMETWTVKVNKHEICGIFDKDDVNFSADSLTVVFLSEYENPKFYI